MPTHPPQPPRMRSARQKRRGAAPSRLSKTGAFPSSPEPADSAEPGYQGPTWALVVAAVVGALLVVFVVCVLLIFLAVVVGGVLFVIVWLLANGVVTPDGIATMIQSFFPFHGR